MTRRISSERVEPVVGYSRAVAAGDFVFVSAARQWRREFVHEGVPTRRRLRHQQTWLPRWRAGGALSDVVRTRIYVTISRAGRSTAAPTRRLRQRDAATSMIEVSALVDPRMLVEVEAVAYHPARQLARHRGADDGGADDAGVVVQRGRHYRAVSPVSSGRNLSDFLLIPPPMMKSPGDSSASMCTGTRRPERPTFPSSGHALPWRARRRASRVLAPDLDMAELVLAPGLRRGTAHCRSRSERQQNHRPLMSRASANLISARPPRRRR